MAKLWKFFFLAMPVPLLEPISGCKEQADIMFLLDNSGSIGNKSFTDVTTFVKNLAGRDLSIGPYNFQMGVIHYHLIVEETIHLSDSRNSTSFLKAVNKIKFHGGSTKTDKAIQKMYNSSFTEEKGARNGVRRICFMFTDGDSYNKNKTTQAANEAKSSGILLFTVGVGEDRNKTELQKIASDPDRDFAYDSPLTKSLRKTLVRRICDVSRPSLPESCSPKADVVFMLDSSGSIRPTNFKLMLSFVKQIFQSFPIGKDSYQFAVQTFNSNVSLEYRLGYDQDIPSLMNAADKITYRGGGTETHKALEALYRGTGPVFGRDGDREDAQNIAILITDGRASEHQLAIDAAETAKKIENIQFFVIGVGSKIKKKEINEIASDPDDDYVLIVNNFSSMVNHVGELKSKLCKAK